MASAVRSYLEGATQRQVAASLGISDAALGYIFRGKTYPEMADIVAPIQHLLGRGTKQRMNVKCK